MPKNNAKIEIFPGPKDAAKQEYFFRLRGANGEIMAASEAYSSKSNARKGARGVKEAIAKAPIVEVDE